MRIPRVHDLTLAYCELFGLPLRPFVMGNPKTLVHIDGQRMTVAEADANPDRLPFDLADHEKGKTWTQLWNEATSEFREQLRAGRPGVARRPAARVRPVLDPRVPGHARLLRGRHRAVRRDELPRVEHERGRRRAAARDRRHAASRTCRRSPAAWTSCRAPSTSNARAVVRFGAEVTRDRAGRRLASRSTTAARPAASRSRGDYAICAIPFSVLRDIEVLGTPSRARSRRRSASSTTTPRRRSSSRSRHRFWEAEDGIVGGTTVTDLPIRRICYPSFSDPDDERGTLLASYTWGQDALRWGAMDGRRRDRAGARGRRPDPPVDHDRVRGRRDARLVRRPVGARRVRALRARAADAAPGRHRRARGPDPLRRRAHVAVPRLDPGRARVGHQGGAARSTKAAPAGVDGWLDERPILARRTARCPIRRRSRRRTVLRRCRTSWSLWPSRGSNGDRVTRKRVVIMGARHGRPRGRLRVAPAGP